MTFRTHGRLSFATIRDSGGDIQIAFVKNLCHFNTGHTLTDSLSIDEKELTPYKIIEKYFDNGDFIGVKGELFMTQHGELTLFVNEFQMMSKALRPLWDKWHGVKDEEKIYRQRYLDMTMNEDSYKRFLFKTEFYDALRSFYKEQWFQEIVTSILWNAASGAAAKPFITHHNDYDLEVFLRIAFEPGLKMATVGRYEKVFEIGKDFRNEGSDPSHLQEFTQVEHYAAYWNYEDNMRFAENMFEYLFDKLNLSKIVSIKDKEWNSRDVNWATPWERIDYIEGVKKASGWIDITQYWMNDAEQLRKDIRALGHEWIGMNEQGTTTLIDYLYKKVLRPWIIGPAFVYNYPKAMQPLARQNDENPGIVEQFQVVVNGWEIIKAYSELVDPTIQDENFQEQAWAIADWDEEATSADYDFLLAMEHGMPPQSWFGMGLERILALLTGQDNLRDVVMFPLMKPVQEQGQKNPVTDASDRPNPEKVPSIEETAQLMDTYLTETKRHCHQVGQCMRWFGEKLWEDADLWQVVGMLHDVDWDHISKDADSHLWDEFEKIMDEIGADEHLKRIIRTHYPEGTGLEPESLVERYLISVDELSGLLHAYSLMRPEWFEWMKWKSINKKIKDKKFAAWVDREHVLNCEKYLDIPLNEFAMDVVEALQSAA